MSPIARSCAYAERGFYTREADIHIFTDDRGGYWVVKKQHVDRFLEAAEAAGLEPRIIIKRAQALGTGVNLKEEFEFRGMKLPENARILTKPVYIPKRRR